VHDDDRQYPGGRELHTMISLVISRKNIFLLFGGLGYGNDSTTFRYRSDTWKFNTTSDIWNWIHGTESGNGDNVYGTMKDYNGANIPSARSGHASWSFKDVMVVFSGESSGFPRECDDVWHFNSTLNLWSWYGGSNITGFEIDGNYGFPDNVVLGLFDSEYYPPYRKWANAVSFEENEEDGFAFFFGGYGYLYGHHADSVFCGFVALFFF